MRFLQAINRFLSARFAQAPWALRIVYSLLVFYLALGLIAAITWLGFGRDAEQQVVELAVGLTEILAIFVVSLLLVGLVALPFHRLVRRKLGDFISTGDRDH